MTERLLIPADADIKTEEPITCVELDRQTDEFIQDMRSFFENDPEWKNDVKFDSKLQNDFREDFRASALRRHYVVDTDLEMSELNAIATVSPPPSLR